jgi:hypothetical protein
MVIGYDPTVSHSCSALTLVAQPLYAGETVKSHGSGDFTFQSGPLQKCIQLPAPKGTGDVLHPRPGVVLRHLRGTTWCRHSKSDKRTRTLRTPGAIIRLNGTTFGIESNGRNSTIKVVAGSVTAISTSSGRFVTIRGGQQAHFPANGSPSPPRKLNPTASDAKAIALLSVGAAPMGILAISQSLQNQGTQATILVAIDSATINTVGPHLTKEKIRFLSVLPSQVKSDPNILNSYATKLGTQTVVVAAPAAEARPILDTVHKAALSLSIIFLDTTAGG